MKRFLECTLVMALLSVAGYGYVEAQSDDLSAEVSVVKSKASKRVSKRPKSKSESQLYVKKTSSKAGNYLEALPLDHKIDSVIVFSDRAEITRKSPASVRSGAKWYLFKGLHQGVNKGSIRLKHSSGKKIKISQILIEQNFEYKALPKEIDKQVTSLRQEYMQILEKRQRLKREKWNLQFLREMDFVTPFTKESKSNPYREFSASVGNLGVAMDSVSKSITKMEGKVSKLNKAIADQKKQIDFLKLKLENVAHKSDQVWMNNVYVLLESSVPLKTTLSLSYEITGAHWYPIYNIRASLNRKSGSAQIKLVSGGVVKQQTGEDWSNVAVTLSTLDPVPLHLPELKRWVFAEQREEAIEADEDVTFGGGGRVMKEQKFERQKVARKRMKKKMAPKAQALRDALGENRAKSDRSGDMMMAEEEALAVPQSPRPSIQGTLRKAGGRRRSRPNRRGGRKGKAKLNAIASSDFPLSKIESIYPSLASVEGLFVRGSLGKSQTKRYSVSSYSKFKKIGHSDSLLPAVQADGRKLEYTSPFRIDLGSDKPSVKIPLHSKNFKGTMSYLAIPKKDERVFLRAKTKNHTDYPILGGKAQIFVNGDLISKTTLSTVGEDGYFTVDMGVDQNIKTKRTVEKKSEKKGLIKKDLETLVKVEIEINNTHGFSVDMDLRDNYPLVNNDQLSVELQKIEPQPKRKKNGVIRWNTKIPAKSIKKFSFTYKVKHPENYLVSEFN